MSRVRKLTVVFQAVPSFLEAEESQWGLLILQWIKEQMSYVCLCEHPCRNEGILKGQLCHLLSYLPIETMVPMKLEFPLKSHPGRKKRLEAWCHPEEKLVSQEEIPPHSSDNLSYLLARVTKVETTAERTTPWLGLLRLVHPCSLFKPKNPTVSLGSSPDLLFVPIYNVAALNKSPFHY